MPVFASIFLVLALVMAVIFGPQTRPWSWGPAMIALGISMFTALPAFWREKKLTPDWMTLGLGALTVAWFAWRASHSPVAELGMSDLLLLGAAVSTFISVRAISGNPMAEKALIWGIAIFHGVFLWVVAKQWVDPSYHPLFGLRAVEKGITGLFSHYNDAANYLLAVSLILAAAGLMGRDSVVARVFFVMLAAAGFVGVFLTQSRGGILGAAVGLCVLAAAALLLAKRRNSRWFAPAIVAVPLIGAGVIAFLFSGWKQRSGGDTHSLLDNDIRLFLLGVAASCIAEHPFHGGGSGSFSWECNRYFEIGIQRNAGARPDMVHNEIVQAATDYGLIGAGLLAAMLCVMAIAAVLRMTFEDRPAQLDSRDAWRLGGIAALAGLFVQSSFSFVFHLVPGVILLGISLGMLSRPEVTTRSGNPWFGRILLSAAALCCTVLLLPAGWKGSQIMVILWPTYFSKQPETSPEARIDALTKAIRIWPQSEFYQDRALIFQEQLTRKDGTPHFREFAGLAVSDYQAAVALHPYHAELFVNLANLLSLLGRDAEAEQAFQRAVELQGGMEPLYRAHFSLAKHLLNSGARLMKSDDPKAAEAPLQRAAQEIEAAVAKMHWVGPEFHEPRVVIHESLGITREMKGDHQGALESYEFAAGLIGGLRVHYRTALLLGKMAVESWSKRQPSIALAQFIEARRRIDLTQNSSPAGVSAEERKEYVAFLDNRIAFLKEARVEPAK